MRRRMGISSLSLAVFLSGVVTGCGNAGNNKMATNTTGNNAGVARTSGVNYKNASGTITWAAPPITQPNDVRPVLIKAFEKAYPKIKVKLQNQDSNTDTDRASLTTAIGGGASTPDVYMGDVAWPAQFAHSGLAMALSDQLPSTFWSRFSSGLTAGATYQGKIYAAPFFADTAFLFYRKDLLKKAGLPVPTSWAQVQSEAKKLQQRNLVQYGFVWQGASYEGLTCDFTEYLADAGGKVLDSQGNVAINSPQATKALNFMRGLITSGVSPKAVDTFQESQSMDVFAGGKAAFLRNWSYAWGYAQDPKSSSVVNKVGVTTLPTFKGGPGYSCVGGWDLYVNPHTKNVAASLAFVDWMTNTAAQTILSKGFGEISTNKAVATNPAVIKSNPIFPVASAVHYVSRPVQNPNYPQISQAIYQNVNAVLSGGQSVANALKKAASQIKSAASSTGL